MHAPVGKVIRRLPDDWLQKGRNKSRTIRVTSVNDHSPVMAAV